MCGGVIKWVAIAIASATFILLQIKGQVERIALWDLDGLFTAYVNKKVRQA